MDAMVKKLLVIAAAATAIAATSAVPATAQPPTAPPASQQPGTGQTSTDDQHSDLYKPCRDLFDGIPDVLKPLVGFDETACDAGAAMLNPGDAVGEAAGGVVKSAIGSAAADFAKGWGKGIVMMFSWWYNTPLTGSTGADQTASIVDKTQHYLRYFQLVVFTMSFAAAMVRLAFARADLRQQQAQEAAMLLTRTVVVSSVLVGLVVALDGAMRAAAMWLLNEFVGANAAAAAQKLITVERLDPLLGDGLLFVFALLGVLGTVVQMVFMLIQIALSKLVLGVLPLVAASTATEAGMQAYRKLIAWTTVFVLFPFISAVVYGVAFALAAGAHDAQGTLAGMVLLTLACLTLPSMVRLVVPMAGQSAGGSGGAAMAALMASGAAPLMRSSSGDSGGGRGGDVRAASASGGPSAGGGAMATGAAPTPSSPSGSGSGGGGVAGVQGASGAAGTAGGQAAAAGAAAAGPAGAVGVVAEKAADVAKATVAEGARSGTGSPDVPPGPGPTGSVPPSGGRSDGNG
ncbi:hypothetical protein [Nocardia terpenica]|uniref:Type IV secretion system protein n=1 Tax=Nocardia terpenica TaxID=455432 RepID=A0A6G9ZDQ2_9NOCA|nr:hypothetical protein [Nocardia terpenica]QIS23642.1 hypothetical protein F6W96_40615 [Nocardia terpenica]